MNILQCDACPNSVAAIPLSIDKQSSQEWWCTWIFSCYDIELVGKGISCLHVEQDTIAMRQICHIAGVGQRLGDLLARLDATDRE